MSGERQGNNPPMENVVDKGPDRVTLMGRIMESKPVQKAISWVAATVTAVSLAPGSMAAETESTVAPDKEIKIEGEMPSQKKAFGGEMAGGGGESPQYITLEPGDKGPEVERLKQGFYYYGYFQRESSVNDTFTTSTSEYVKKFEEINGLPVDGIADSEMQALLFSDKARKANGELIVSEPYLSKEILLGSEEEKIIDARFKSFLEGTGEFSDKKLRDKMFYSFVKGEVDLGLCGLTNNGVNYVVQGVLLGYFQSENKLFVAIGAKNKENEREIVLTQLLVKEQVDAYSFAMTDRVVVGQNSVSHKNEYLYSNDDVISFIEGKLGSVVLFNFINSAYKLSSSIDKKIHDYYSKYVLPRGDVNINYLSNLFVNLDSKSLSLRETSLSNVGVIDQELNVVNYSDVMDKLAKKSEDKFPLLDYISYRSNK